MINIRYGTFETNSSSVHSLMIATDDVYKQLVAGALYIDSYHDTYITRTEATNLLLTDVSAEELSDFWHNYLEKDTELIPTVEWFNTLSIDDFDEFLREFGDGISSFENYGGEYYERYDEEYTSEHGDKIHIFGYYGRDC